MAFFFSAISTQGPKKAPKDKDKTDEGNGAESDGEPFTESQVSSTSSQAWISTHPAVIDKKLRPALSYWIALTTPNGAPANPITVHRALLECGVSATVSQVRSRPFCCFEDFDFRKLVLALRHTCLTIESEVA